MPCDTCPRSLIVLMRNPAATAPSACAGLKLLARRNSNSARSGRSESISQYTTRSPGLNSPFFATTHQPSTRSFSIASALGIGSAAFTV